MENFLYIDGHGRQIYKPNQRKVDRQKLIDRLTSKPQRYSSTLDTLNDRVISYSRSLRPDA